MPPISQLFASPVGLWALLGVPAVLALHFFRRRFRPRPVSALFLWREARPASASGRRRERLQRTSSLGLELLAALCLGLGVAGPRGCTSSSVDHLVVVLDGSASMGAALPSGESPAAAAQALVADELAALGQGARATIVVSGTPPTLLGRPGAFAAEARAALVDYTPTLGQHALEPAVAWARELAGGEAVWLLTDTFAPDRFGAGVRLTALGEPVENSALLRAAREPSAAEGATAGTEQLFVSAVHYGRQPRATTLTLEADGRTLASRPVQLAPDERVHWTFELPAQEAALTVRLDADALEIDDRAILEREPERVLNLATNLGGEALRQLGLGADAAGALERLTAWIPNSRASALADAHLALVGPTEATAPAVGPDAWTLVLHAEEGERPAWIGPFVRDPSHPLLDGLTLEGIVWSGGATSLPGLPLVSAGTVPLLTESRDGRRRRFHLELDPARSSLQLSPDWPILLSNLAELRRSALPGAARANLLVGESFEYRARDPGRYLLEGEGEAARSLESHAGALVVGGLGSPGRYRLREAESGALLARFAVQFSDPAESDLRALSRGERASDAPSARAEGASRWSWILALFALVAIGLDWWVLGRGGAPRAGGPA